MIQWKMDKDYKKATGKGKKERERKLRMWETIQMNNVKDFQTSDFMSKHKKHV